MANSKLWSPPAFDKAPDAQCGGEEPQVLPPEQKAGDEHKHLHMNMSSYMLNVGFMPPEIMAAVQAYRMDEEYRNASFEKEGKRYVIPAGASYQQAIDFYKRKIEEEQKMINMCQVYECFPYDGAYAAQQVIGEIYGQSLTEEGEIQTFFGKMKTPPETVKVQINKDETRSVIWGGLSIPGIEGTVYLEMVKVSPSRIGMQLRCEVKGKYREPVGEFLTAVQKKLKDASIYKGQAWKINFRDETTGTEMFFGPTVMPKFMNFDGLAEPIYTKITESQFRYSVLSVIRNTDKLREKGISRKRTILLEGGYGCGKTLAATMVARECVANGWTFMYVSSCEDIVKAMQLAKQYTPCCVFVEDADRVMQGDRGFSLDQLSYALDGVDNKNDEIMTVLTTNKIDNIAKLMMRPGRIDSVIRIQKPDLETAWRFIRAGLGDQLVINEEEHAECLLPLVGKNSSFLTEVIKSCNLMALCADSPVTMDILVAAVESVQSHIDLMTENNEPKTVKVNLTDLDVTVPAGAVLTQ